MPGKMSAASPGALLALIRERGGLTRQELLSETGMARSTLMTRLDLLITHGLIHEARHLVSRGRPASVLSPDTTDRVALAIDIGHHKATAAVYDLAGHCLAEHVLALDDAPLPTLVDRLLIHGSQLLGALPSLRLVGVGLAIPAPVDTHTGVRMSSVALPDRSFPLTDAIAGHFGVDVVVENDARALALGSALEVPPLDDDSVLIGVKFSTGIGVGLITGNHIMRGTNGTAGDLGHLQVTPGTGPVCTCGRRGCLAAYASGRALVDALGRADVPTVTELAALYDEGDDDVCRLIHQAAATLGRNLGGLIQVASPQYVVFGGVLGGRPSITERVIAEIRPAVSDRIDGQTRYSVVNSDRTTGRGLVQMVADHYFDPDRIDANLSVGPDARSISSDRT
ncbi:MAG: ROK family protein [Propionibacteriaceae bacterium]